MSEIITIKVVIDKGISPASIGETFAEAGCTWREDGDRRLFLTCPNDDSVDYIENELAKDERVINFETVEEKSDGIDYGSCAVCGE